MLNSNHFSLIITVYDRIKEADWKKEASNWLRLIEAIIKQISFKSRRCHPPMEMVDLRMRRPAPHQVNFILENYWIVYWIGCKN